MDSNTRRFVVCGATGRNGGIVGCTVGPCAQYDHKVHYAAKLTGTKTKNQQEPQWDFVIWREDGTAVRFHPEWSTHKFNVYEVELTGGQVLKDAFGVPQDSRFANVAPPPNGPGGSWGSGTFWWYKNPRVEVFHGKFETWKGKDLLPLQCSSAD